MDLQQVCVSSALSGSLVAFLCTPFDVVKNYSQYTAISSGPPPPAAPPAAGLSPLRRVLPTDSAAPSSHSASSNSSSSSSSSNSSSSSRKAGGSGTNSSIKTAAKLYRAKGPLVFWRGVGPAVGVLVPANIIFFTLYERRDPEGSAAVAGVAARTTAVLCTAPIELVRTQLQAHCCSGGSSSKSAAFSLMQQTIKAEGLGGLFKGVFPTIIRDAPFSAFYWPLTAATSRMLRHLLPGDHSSSSNSSSKGIKGFRDRAVIPFIAGASSSAIACVLTHPFDVIKTRVQAAQMMPKGGGPKAARRGACWYLGRGVRDACIEVYTAQGLNGFGVGLLPRLLKIVPSCAVLLATYEATKALWGSSLLDQM